MFNSLPMYHRIGKAAYKADMTNTLELMEHLGHPERKFRSIHVAGTNGKGSVSHMTASILQEAGYKVGLYTSPHLVDFRERIRINGKMIPQERVTSFVEQHRSTFDRLRLSFFEMTVGLAFDYFAQEQVDVAVVEVGMGGRLDSTNVVTPQVSVITNIGFDHTQFLGSTLAAIASEKAGIIKSGVPVVIGESHPETKPVFEQKASEMQAPIQFADQHYRLVERPAADDYEDALLHFDVLRSNAEGAFQPYYTGMESPLSGSYQLHNIATLMMILEQVQTLYPRVDEQAIRQGIARTITNTGLHGRWEVMAHRPLTICETAHNADGVRAMLAKLSEMHYTHLHLVYGCVNDKDYRAILRMLPTDATYYYTQPSVPRALPVNELAAAAHELGMPGSSHPDVGAAIQAARETAVASDLVLVTGSIFLVADAVALLPLK